MKRVQANSKKVASSKSKPSVVRTSSLEFGKSSRSGAQLSEAPGRHKLSKTYSSTKAKVSLADSRVLEYAEVLAHAVDTFGSRTRANAWLNRPSRIFNNQSPIQVLTQDPVSVEEELVRIDHGIFA